MKTKKEAEKIAAYFKEQLKDLGEWEVVIDKNIEYFVYAINGPMSISIDTYLDNEYYYNVYFCKEGAPLESDYGLSVDDSFDNPKAAIDAQKTHVIKFINRYTWAVQRVLLN